ncbi:hypothetical protein ROJ8625_02571 [Roseivivax jejudonensis]|uniref:Uncharacterized protein n=1 Tax=Roseivivax jejudonensis TaxID=1529041 RepID=A0A1X6ZHS9_9RHOB|nr:hypothetical protein [Roseivivax jejudonensis]SLN51513.1 hypothetical protein ROJ8625_02571 [Roseivivax jejudonensis]
MRQLLTILSLIAAPAVPTAAQDFSDGSEASEWGLFGEQKARFEAAVVDPLCLLAGACDQECAPGRQLALERQADGVLVMPLKNRETVFSGAVADLAPYCGETVEVDGLLIENPEIGATNVYQVQRIRRLSEEEWTETNRFTEVWARENPSVAGEGPWFRRDPRVTAEIEEEGWLGLGPEAEDAFVRDWLGVE